MSLRIVCEPSFFTEHFYLLHYWDALKLANFLASAEAQEALFQQRTRDFETQQVLQMIEGKVTPLTQYQNQREVEQQEPTSVLPKSVVINEPEPETDLDWDELEVYEEF